jgi:hypothetical protein
METAKFIKTASHNTAKGMIVCAIDANGNLYRQSKHTKKMTKLCRSLPDHAKAIQEVKNVLKIG